MGQDVCCLYTIWGFNEARNYGVAVVSAGL